jgi:uridylate kinase
MFNNIYKNTIIILLMKKVIVISLGGSLIVPDRINYKFLSEFREVLQKNRGEYKFVVVAGGGSVARTYIKGIENENMKEKKKDYFQSLLGISITRLNARFLTYFFRKDANQGIPRSMKEVKNLLKKNDFVFCGALRYEVNQTSDSTSAKLAHYFDCEFINLTNVAGLYTKDPKKYKSAKLVNEISHKDFQNTVKKIKFKPGQHFVLDQKAAKIIKKHRIPTYIFGSDMENLDNFLSNKHFVGTIIN